MPKTLLKSSKIVPQIGDKLYTARELAELWKVSYSTIVRLCRNRELAHTRIGATYVISTEQAKLYLRERTFSG